MSTIESPLHPDNLELREDLAVSPEQHGPVQSQTTSEEVVFLRGYMTWLARTSGYDKLDDDHMAALSDVILNSRTVETDAHVEHMTGILEAFHRFEVGETVPVQYLVLDGLRRIATNTDPGNSIRLKHARARAFIRLLLDPEAAALPTHRQLLKGIVGYHPEYV